MSKILGIHTPLNAKNLFINGNMDFWQRSTSVTLTGTFGYQSTDRWGGWNSGAGSMTISRDTAVPNTNSQFSMKLTGATSATTVRMIQRIESKNLIPFINGKVMLSFWVLNVTGGTITPTWSLQQPATTDVHVAGSDTFAFDAIPFAQSCANNVWTRVYALIDLSLISGIERGAAIWISPGVNLDTTGKSFYISQAMLTPGASLPDRFIYNGDTVTDELEACQRYFEKSYSINTNPGTVTDVGSYSFYATATYTNAPRVLAVVFKATKRTEVTPRAYSPATGAADKIRNATAGADRDPRYDSSGVSSFNLGVNDGTGFTVGQRCEFHWVAEAEL